MRRPAVALTYGAGVTDAQRPTTVAVINDYEVVVRGVLGLLEPFGDRVAVLELDVDLPVSADVDVALYDAFSMTGTHTQDLDDIVGNPHIGALVIYTWNLQDAVVAEALARGVRGVLSKSLSAADLVTCIERVCRGEVVVHPEPTGDSPVVPGDWPGRRHGLTVREAEVVALITQGLSNNEIATRSYLSINSVKSYIRSAYRTMGVTSRSQAVRWGMEHGIDSTPKRISLTSTSLVGGPGPRRV